jgi:hypothetical protein
LVLRQKRPGQALRGTWESAWARTADQPADTRSVTLSEWREEIWSTYDCSPATHVGKKVFDKLILSKSFNSVRVDIKGTKKGIVKLHTSCAGIHPMHLKKNNIELAFVPATHVHIGGPAGEDMDGVQYEDDGEVDEDGAPPEFSRRERQ